MQDNAIYNLLPDIISRLSDPDCGVDEESFHTIMRYVKSEMRVMKSVLTRTIGLRGTKSTEQTTMPYLMLFFSFSSI